MSVLNRWLAKITRACSVLKAGDSLRRLSVATDAAMRAWAETEELPAGYIKAYAGVDNQRSLIAHYGNSVKDKINNFHDSDGVDFGCWFGFSTLALAALGWRKVYGVEVIKRFNDAACNWQQKQPFSNIEFLFAENGAVPLASSSIDWVVINQVLCNALPDSFSTTLAEAARVLCKGGQLILSDSNNPHCPAVVKRLTQTYKLLEIGDGTRAEPDGSNYRDRKRMLQQHHSELTATELSSLARGSCYSWGKELSKLARAYKRSGNFPTDCFEEGISRAPCNPRSGAALGNVTDPLALEDHLQALGFSTYITTAPSNIPTDDEAMMADLRGSQGFYIYANKQ